MYVYTSVLPLDESFWTARSQGHSVTNKHTEAYNNYKLFGLLFRLITNYLL